MRSLDLILSMAVTLFVILAAVLGALFGLARGYKRSIVTLIGTVVSAVLAFLLATPISRLLLSQKNIEMLINKTSFASTVEQLTDASPALAELIEVLPAAIVSPIVFIVLFVVIKLIMKIPCGLISTLMGKKSTLRPIGLPIGAIQGVVSASVIVLVLAGLISTADNITTVVLQDDSSSTAEIRNTVQMVDDYIETVKKDPVVNLLCPAEKTNEENVSLSKTTNATSVNPVFKKLTSFSYQKDNLVLNDEIVDIADMTLGLTPLLSNTEVATWTEAEIQVIESFAENFKNSKILINITPELVAKLCDSWAKGEEFIGMKRPVLDPTVDPILQALFESMKTTTSETLSEDIGAIVDILKVFYKHGLFEKLLGETPSEELLSALKGEFISELLKLLSANDRFCVLVPEVTNMGLRVLATTLKLPENNNEIYQNISNDISQSLSNVLSNGINDESLTQFSNEMLSTLNKNGVPVSQEATDIVSKAIAENFASKESVSAEEIQNFFGDFAVIYDALEKATGEQVKSDETPSVNLSTNLGNEIVTRSTYSSESMNYNEKLSVLALIGVYDIYCEKFDLSSPTNVLENGMNADEFVSYLISIVNVINETHEKISSLGSSKENPLVSLGSADTLITTKITAESLKIASDAKFTESDIDNFSNCIESITQFVESYSKIEGDLSLDSLQDLDIAAAGRAFDSLKNISSLSSTVDQLSNAVISTVVGSDVNITDKMNDTNTSFEELFTTVKSTAEVISNITKEDQNSENKEGAILDLLLNLTPATAEIVTDVVTVDLVIQQGVPAEYASVSVQALRAAFVAMANLTGDDHEFEAKYISLLFELATVVKTSGNTNSIIGEEGLFESEEQLVDMTIHSKVATVALKSITTDKDGNPVYDALHVSKNLNDTNKAKIAEYAEQIYNDSKSELNAEELADLEVKIMSISYLLNVEMAFLNK